MINIRYPIVEQTSISDCGASCLYMILKYYGGFENIDNLKKLTNTTKEGTTFYNLKEAAISLGFNATCYYLEEKELNLNLKVPFIAHVLIDNTYYHYIVVYKVLKKKLLVADPAKGILEYWKIEKFKQIFEGNIMILYPSRPLYRNISHLTVSKMWKTYIKKDRKILLKMIILSIITIFIEILSATSFYTLIHFVNNNNNIHLLFKIFLLFCSLILFKNIFTYFRNKLFCCFEIELNHNLKQERWRNILNLPYHDLILKETGEITLSLEYATSITEFFLKIFVFVFLDIPVFLITFILLLLLQKESILFIILLTFQIILFYHFSKKQRKYIKTHEINTSKIKKIEEEIKESLISLKNINLENNTKKRLKKHYSIYKKEEKSFLKKILFITLFKNTILEISNLCTSLFIVVLLFYNMHTLENCILLFQLFSFLNHIINNFVDILLEKEKIKIYLESYLEEKIKEEKIDKINNIEMKNVRYQKFSNLKNISFHLEKGDKLLLFGKSGIGKSTLMNIIKGNYKVDNYFINEKDKNIFSKKICYVESNPFIYTDTIEDNIKYEKLISSKELEEMMSILHINDVKMQNNINYLSSGEKQKISLARALFTEFDVLILDESLNQISEQEEKEIMKNILKKYNDKIIIVISHRKNLLKLFNKIAVLTNHGQLKFIKGKEKLCLEDFLKI